MKKVIYSYISDNETSHIVEFLKRKANWEPIFFHGYSGMEEWVGEKYPDATLVDSIKLRQGIFDYSQIGIEQPIDAKLIENLSRYESNYISWLQDTTGWNFSYQERRTYYYDVLKYWNTVICNLKPDIFVSYTWPHVQSDYALYLLCTHHFKIPVLFLDIVPFLDNYYHTVGCELEDLSKPFMKYYRSTESLTTHKVVSDYLVKLRAPTPNTPQHITRYFDYLDNARKNKLGRYLRVLMLIITGRAFKKSDSTFKCNQKKWGTKNSQLSILGLFLFKERLSIKNKKLRIQYLKLIENPSIGEKYIYFAAPYQPEAISNITCGVYEEPFLILDMISASLPKAWKIYYKEHPNTFKDADKGALYRSQEYYEKLSRYDNVRIISTDTNTFSLIDNAQGVATTGGTVGWEAIVRGKPALVFGSLWYQGCDSVFTIKTYEDLLNSVSRIVSGYLPVEKDVDRYAQGIYLACEKNLITMTNYANLISKCDDPIHEMERIADLFIKQESRFYGSQD